MQRRARGEQQEAPSGLYGNQPMNVFLHFAHSPKSDIFSADSPLIRSTHVILTLGLLGWLDKRQGHARARMPLLRHGGAKLPR